MPFAALFFLAGMLIERLHHPGDSRYFYSVAVALRGRLERRGPLSRTLRGMDRRVVPRTRGQMEYLFMINAGIYLLLQSACERLPLAQMRAVGKSFRFVIPGHVLTSLLLLGCLPRTSGRNRPRRRAQARSSLLRSCRWRLACLFSEVFPSR